MSLDRVVNSGERKGRRQLKTTGNEKQRVIIERGKRAADHDGKVENADADLPDRNSEKVTMESGRVE